MRPADAVAQAVMIGRIATGEAGETCVDRKKSAAGKLTAERRRETAYEWRPGSPRDTKWLKRVKMQAESRVSSPATAWLECFWLAY